MKEKHRLLHDGTEVLSDIFIGSVLRTGWDWTTDLLIAEWHDIKE